MNQNLHLMESSEIAELINQISNMIYDENRGAGKDQLILIGIQRSGVPLSERLADCLFKKTGIHYPVGTLDTAMYRDDIGMRKTLPHIYETRIPMDINGKTIILVDDILQTGRSIRAALDAITYFGRPSIVRLAVLFDRGMREFPIQGDYVGKKYELDPVLRLKVSWRDFTGTDDYVYSMETPNIKAAK